MDGNRALKIAVIADVHYGESDQGTRRCDIADILLERAVIRIKRLIRPDVVLVLGDIVDQGSTPGAGDRLKKLRSILDKLSCPYIAIPGNHDGDVDGFYRVFDRPDDVVDIAGARFLPFIDREEPRYDASRSVEDLARARVSGEGAPGPVISLQHVCLHPPRPEREPPYYNYTNADDVIASLKEAGVTLSVSGHYHQGVEDIHDGDLTFVNAPGLCEPPHPILEISIDKGKVTTRRHELVMPPELKLRDNHLHTQLAYCSDDMVVVKAVKLAEAFGLAGVTFTEHSGQLYFDRKPYWRGAWMQGFQDAEEKYNRMQAYLDLKRAHENEFARFSLEVECDAKGNLVLKQDDAKQFHGLMGTIHALPGLTKEAPPEKTEVDDFLRLVDAMGQKGIRILAHPLRVFMRCGWDAPVELFEPTAKLLRKHGVAAEINFHSNNKPPVEFVRFCLDNGVKLSFGSDAHMLAEIGEFGTHIALLREAGYDGDITDVLV